MPPLLSCTLHPGRAGVGIGLVGLRAWGFSNMERESGSKPLQRLWPQGVGWDSTSLEPWARGGRVPGGQGCVLASASVRTALAAGRRRSSASEGQKAGYCCCGTARSASRSPRETRWVVKLAWVDYWAWFPENSWDPVPELTPPARGVLPPGGPFRSAAHGTTPGTGDWLVSDASTVELYSSPRPGWRWHRPCGFEGLGL